MNVQPKLPLTAAETALVGQFADQSGALPGNAEMAAHREKALQAISASGLPTRRVEAWHYTDLRRLLADVPERKPDANVSEIKTLTKGIPSFVLKNGMIADVASVDGVSVTSMADVLRADISGVKPADHGVHDAVGLINSAFVTDGFVMKVDDGFVAASPIELQSLHDGGQTHTRNAVTVGSDANVTIFDRHAGSDKSVLASSVTDLKLRKGAKVLWVTVQEQGEAATHLGQVNLTLEDDAELTLFNINLSGKVVRQEVNADVVGEGAKLTFRSVNLVGDKTHCDVTLSLGHLVPNTSSTETVRNVVTGQGQGVFQGQIQVAQIAQKTDAQMACNTLLLSDTAGFATKPELEIFADDVVCAHGATVAEIDHDHLFYLMARGISEKMARGLLIKAFVAEIIEELEDEDLIADLEARLENWLEAHA
ncbi:Fe-S cluster assembly protein SufD [Oricola cellulosilytica]|uniref:Fe-S cluster assembly protein SufD n=1 Tax=Oricola cellulosilytica TaxID=1429082 RepID=A0A4R0P9K3_9HYPH|nr:Fe-S cluster assembly protein SufD [Oricola cellulosilytica]TCD12412.1 Fe-S cluster assembly protein SufD [Oricola cellulosilytica]